MNFRGTTNRLRWNLKYLFNWRQTCEKIVKE